MVIVKFGSSRTDCFKAAFQEKLGSMPQRLVDEVKQYEEEVAKLQILADCEITDARFQHLTDSSDAIAQSLNKIFSELRQSNLTAYDLGIKTAKHIESVSTLLETERKDKVLAWVSEIAYRDVHNRKAMKGTGQ